jgi:hypothetical protein
MTSGSITLNGVDDATLALVLKFKAEHEGTFLFNPSVMQMVGNPNKPVYNQMTFTWSSQGGVKTIIELLQRIESHHSELKSG